MIVIGQPGLRFAITPDGELQVDIMTALAGVFPFADFYDTAQLRAWQVPAVLDQVGLWFEVHRVGVSCDVYPIAHLPMSSDGAEIQGALRAFYAIAKIECVRLRFQKVRAVDAPRPASPTLSPSDWRQRIH